MSLYERDSIDVLMKDMFKDHISKLRLKYTIEEEPPEAHDTQDECTICAYCGKVIAEANVEIDQEVYSLATFLPPTKYLHHPETDEVAMSLVQDFCSRECIINQLTKEVKGEVRCQATITFV